jgi:hypothetical protein
MKSKLLFLALIIILGMMAITNPTVEQYRGHVRERQGLAGTLGLLAADVLTAGDQKNSGGIHRENYWVFSKFYIGGDGLLPRHEVAWGALGRFWEIDDRGR